MTSQEVTFSSGEITTNRDHTSNLCMLGLCLMLGLFFPKLPPSALPPPGCGSATHLLRLCHQLTWTTSEAISRSTKARSAAWCVAALVVNARGNVLSSWERRLWLFLPSGCWGFLGNFLFQLGFGSQTCCQFVSNQPAASVSVMFFRPQPIGLCIKCHSNKPCFL